MTTVRRHVFERVTVLEQDDEHRWWPMAEFSLGRPMVIGRGSFDVELSVVSKPDPAVAAWADELWEAYSRERYGPQVHPFERYSIVARVQGKAVGYAEGDLRGTALKLGRLIVSPEWRGLGIGSHLLRAVELFALERGCELVRLETLAGERPEKLSTRARLCCHRHLGPLAGRLRLRPHGTGSSPRARRSRRKKPPRAPASRPRAVPRRRARDGRRHRRGRGASRLSR